MRGGCGATSVRIGRQEHRRDGESWPTSQAPLPPANSVTPFLGPFVSAQRTLMCWQERLVGWRLQASQYTTGQMIAGQVVEWCAADPNPAMFVIKFENGAPASSGQRVGGGSSRISRNQSSTLQAHETRAHRSKLRRTAACASAPCQHTPLHTRRSLCCVLLIPHAHSRPMGPSPVTPDHLPLPPRRPQARVMR